MQMSRRSDSALEESELLQAVLRSDPPRDWVPLSGATSGPPPFTAVRTGSVFSGLLGFSLGTAQVSGEQFKRAAHSRSAHHRTCGIMKETQSFNSLLDLYILN